SVGGRRRGAGIRPLRALRGRRRPRGVPRSRLAGPALRERAQAGVLLRAGRAALEMCPHAQAVPLACAFGRADAGRAEGELVPELGIDVAVEVLEAVVAAELGRLGAEQAVGRRGLVHGSTSRARWARRFRRASWRVL